MKKITKSYIENVTRITHPFLKEFSVRNYRYEAKIFGVLYVASAYRSNTLTIKRPGKEIISIKCILDNKQDFINAVYNYYYKDKK